MGKYIVLTTFAVILSTTLLARQGMQTDLDTSQSQAERQKKVLARQIASSAFKMGVSELKQDFENWRVNREGVAYEGGTFDLSATGPSGGPVTLTAVGHFGETTYEITATATLEETTRSLFNAITAGEDVDFEVSGGACPGGACVSGIDGAGNGDRHGITLGEADDGEDDDEGEEEDDGEEDDGEEDDGEEDDGEEDDEEEGEDEGEDGEEEADQNEGDENASTVCQEFNGKVEGVGDGCDVVNRKEERNEVVEDQVETLKSQIESLPESKKTVCEAEGAEGEEDGEEDGEGEGEEDGGGPPFGGPPGGGPSGSCMLNPPESGQGVYFVKGDLTINGNAHWDGLVFVAEGGSVTINGGGSGENINGSLVMEEDTDFKINGGGAGNVVKYNSAELLNLVNALPYVSTKVVRISNRNGAFV